MRLNNILSDVPMTNIPKNVAKNIARSKDVMLICFGDNANNYVSTKAIWFVIFLPNWTSGMEDGWFDKHLSSQMSIPGNSLHIRVKWKAVSVHSKACNKISSECTCRVYKICRTLVIGSLCIVTSANWSHSKLFELQHFKIETFKIPINDAYIPN